MMNRLNFGRRSGTVVDVCRGHGTFLDRGELHQVMRFVQEGGLNRSLRSTKAGSSRHRLAEMKALRDEQRRLSMSS